MKSKFCRWHHLARWIWWIWNNRLVQNKTTLEVCQKHKNWFTHFQDV